MQGIRRLEGLRVAVVGHVEWSDFASLERYPDEGEVVHAHAWSARPGGGGTVAAVALTLLGARVDFFTALGRDAFGEASVEALRARGVRVHVAWRHHPTRRAITYLTTGGDRTIVVMGPRLEPRGEDDLNWAALDDVAGVFFTAGDPEALRRARETPVLVASPRGREALESEGVVLDGLVFSESDADEAAWATRLQARARLVVATRGHTGGRWWGESEGRWDAAAPPGPVRDYYGAGDSFAAAFMAGLAAGRSVAEAAELGAFAGALALTWVGAP
jgi:ribokinase